MSIPESHEVFAVRYATMPERRRHHNFIGLDPHDDAPMPIDYYVWLIRNENRTIVVDTGFEPGEATKRGRDLLRLPRDGLAMLGVDPETVEDVIVTHLHWDHAGTLDDFPRARFHLQDREMIAATGRCMCHPPLRASYSVDYVCNMVRRVFDGRVTFHDGDDELAPGITLHHVGGHAAGMQFVRVMTERGWVVLASDASHFYENMERCMPFPIVHDMAAMLEGYGRLRRHASSPRHVVPGHDPLVMRRYPAPERGLAGAVARLDVPPIED